MDMTDLDVRMRGHVLQRHYCLLLLRAADHKTLQLASDTFLVLTHKREMLKNPGVTCWRTCLLVYQFIQHMNAPM
jgi:hypothetical protein